MMLLLRGRRCVDVRRTAISGLRLDYRKSRDDEAQILSAVNVRQGGFTRGALLAALIFSTSAMALAADKAQPLDITLGLWEISSPKTSAPQPISPEVLAKLTPEQRSRLELRIKARSSSAQKMISQKHCVTREELEKGTAFDEEQKTCTLTRMVSTNSQLETKLDCGRQGNRTDEVILVEAVDTHHVKGVVKFWPAGHEDTPLNTRWSFTAQWIGPRCGEPTGR
jgi:hypothetical protein